MFKKTNRINESSAPKAGFAQLELLTTSVPSDQEYRLVDPDVSCQDLFGEEALEISRFEYANTTKVLGVLVPGGPGGKRKLYSDLVDDLTGVVCYQAHASDHRALSTDTMPICEDLEATAKCIIEYSDNTPYPSNSTTLEKLVLFLQGGPCNAGVNCQGGGVSPRSGQLFFVKVYTIVSGNETILFNDYVREGTKFSTTQMTEEDLIYIKIFDISSGSPVLVQYLGFRVSALHLHQVLGSFKVVGWKSDAFTDEAFASAEIDFHVQFTAPSDTFIVKTIADFGGLLYNNAKAGIFAQGNDVTLGKTNLEAKYIRDNALARTQIIDGTCCIYLQTWCTSPTPSTPMPTPMPTPSPICDPNENLIENGSFEANPVPNGQTKKLSLSAVPGWMSYDGGKLKLYNNVNGVSAPDGNNYAELDDVPGNATEGIYQYINTVKDRIYTLSFYMRARDPNNANSEDEGIVVSLWLWNHPVSLNYFLPQP